MTEATKERLYNLLPAVYKARDSLEGEPLRALLGLVEGEMRLLEEDIEGLYDDWFIETCDDWVIPYIGDLLGVHAVHSLSARGANMRSYVANTIAYRRRKGTAAVLEQVSRDVTGWSSHAVEFFQLLAVTQHLNHLRLDKGRTACVRDADEIELAGGPFEKTAHTLDVRRIATRGGKYNIPNVGIFLWRLQSYPLDQVAARSVGVFSWDKVPKKDDEKLIEFLAKKFRIDWVKTAKIEKTNDGNIIKVSTDRNFLSLELNDKKIELILKIDDIETDKFIAKMENGELNIYEKNLYTFDPTGLEIHLFNRPQTENWITHLSEEINVPGSLRRYPLYNELEARRNEDVPQPSYFDPHPVFGIEIFDGGPNHHKIPLENIFICNMAEWRYPPHELEKAITSVSGFSFEVEANGGATSDRPLFSGEVVEVFSDLENDPGTFATIVKAEQVGLKWVLTLDEDISRMATHTNLCVRRITVAIDPERGRLTVLKAVSPQNVLVSYSYGFSGDVGAGPYDRTSSIQQILAGEVDWQVGVSQEAADGSTIFETVQGALNEWNLEHGSASETKVGLIVIMDSRTYNEKNLKVTVPEGCKLLIVAANWPEPRSKGQFAARGLRPHLLGEIEVSGGTSSASDSKSNPGKLVIDGLLIEGKLKVSVDNLSLRVAHTTLVPGIGGIKIDSTSSVELTIDRSICGPIEIAGNASSLILGESILCDSIIAENAAAQIDRCTVLGKSNLRRLEASNSIFMEKVTVKQRQNGCVRFSYLPYDSPSPRRFCCQPDLALVARKEALGKDFSDEEKRAVKIRLRPAFTSVHYGDPGYVQLSFASAKEVRTGAEDGSEMGVFGILEQPQREANLRAALEEYMRFGLEAGIFYVT
jgi:hypothetical protein